ncbi:MFS transporter [Mucilaginibacter conchicola]|uniref:MFS transporter n=1 Tax=Mucilaginibacter conchicola TaxID=2303333 RepID=A0A372NPT6_9SPHI|nr:MFS transporter [Mucilaginibacter conchicola]RFZ90273.1 MFS transporter [Mucilaginibacter conchicola]
MRNFHHPSVAKQALPVAAILVASLGYFVDIYDLLLFSIIRLPSLHALGLSGAKATSTGIFLLNVQMAGLLSGGIFWGILGDKKGRLNVLFGSILLYSVANIANGLVTSVNGYALFRLIAGFGLAGELGAGVTLVVELMPAAKRGYATTMIAGVGIAGAVVAHFVAQYFDWRTAFFTGGGLGLCLLFLRIGLAESHLYTSINAGNVIKGNFFSLFTDRERFRKYICCILIGLPLWFGVGILITLSPEFGRALGTKGAINAGAAVACCYGGSVIGDILSGLLSQYLRSRIKVVAIFLTLTAVSIGAYLSLTDLSVSQFYFLCGCFGFSAGYWVLFLTIAAEQFGTNIRSTVTTTVPNFVRGAVIPLSLLFQYLRVMFYGSLVSAGAVVGLLSLLLAFWALYRTRETFSVDLNYTEN